MILTIADLAGAHTGGMDEIDPAARPRRRTFTAAEKLGYLEAYDALPKGGPERGAFLRREGLYSSHLSEWRKQRDNGALAGLTAKPREAELERTKMALEIMGKARALWELISESADTEPRSKR